MNLLSKFFCFLLTLSGVIVNAQSTDLSGLPSYDCSLKKVMAIIGRPTLLVSPDNGQGLDPILKEYCALLGEHCIQKKESELTDSDFKRDMFLIGELSQFKRWNSYLVPVTQLKNGFIINQRRFLDKSDGFVYVDSNHIIITGNSLQAVKDAKLALTGGHDLVITQKGKITWFGNQRPTGFNWFNLQTLPLTNYTERPSPIFTPIFISKKFEDSIDYASMNAELKVYSSQFISVYKIKRPKKPVTWFLHKDMEEYGIMSGLFGLTCPGNQSAGFSIRGEIHTLGYNLPLVKHEYSHYLFDAAVPQEYNPAFFVEGCVEYVSNLNDTALYNRRLMTARQYRDSLNYDNLIINNLDFYNQYSAVNYDVSGVFVKYLIDQFGVGSFKKYCVAPDKRAACEAVFRKEFDEIIAGYKVWLDQ